MRYLWDTHAWIWAANDDGSLSRRARQLLTSSGPTDHAIADISLWEVAMLVARGRVVLNVSLERWLDQALANVSVLPISKGVALRATAAEWTHQDPADRLIVATALEHGLVLVSKDATITQWGGVKVVW